MLRCFKYRLFPNINQARELSRTLETHRRLYNQALDERIFCWETAKCVLNFAFQSKRFLIQRKHNPHYTSLNVTSAQGTLRRLDSTYRALFRRIMSGKKGGFPRFKSNTQFNSWTYYLPSGGGASFVGKKLRLQHIGTLRIKQHRKLTGKIKTIQIVRELEKWFAVVTCDVADPIPVTRDAPVGIDMGLEFFLTTSNGEHYPNPRYLKNALPTLARVQRNHSRKKKGGTNRRKQLKKLQKVHLRIKNLRKDHHHKTALSLVRKYGAIAVESLTISNMVKNRRLARSISDAGWRGFLSILRCKAENAGIQYIEVSSKNTSQVCSGCGEVVKKDLRVRIHDCPHCQTLLHRDHNAALNILARAKLAWAGPVEYNVSARD